MSRKSPAPISGAALDNPPAVARADRVDHAGAPEPAAAVRQVDGAAEARPVVPAAPAAAVGAAPSVERAARTTRIADIAGRLRRGEIGAAQAVEELIDDAVRDNLAGLGDDDSLGEELRQALRAYAAENPLLLGRARRLGTIR